MKGGVLTKALILMVAIWALLKLGMPLFTAPLPNSLIFLYLMLTFSGIVIFGTLSGTSKDAFWGPISSFITGDNLGALQGARLAVLILFPLLIGWQTYGSTAPSDQPPAENRTIHPAPPGEYTGLANPVPNTPENMERWLREPHRVNPDSAMPDLGVTEQDARDMAAFLRTLK